jgi:putative transposase
VVKYRKRLLVNDLSDDIKQWCYDVCNKNNVKIDEMETDKDHLHLLVDIPPTLAPSKLVVLLKQQTTFNAWKNYEAYLKKHFWKEKTFWSDGYFVCSTGDASTKTIQEYIKNQG